MTSQEFPDNVQVTTGDIIRDSSDNYLVVFAVRPALQAGLIVRDKERGFNRIGNPGNPKGPIEVIGRMTLDQVIRGFIVRNVPERLAEAASLALRAELEAQQEQGPIEIENF